MSSSSSSSSSLSLLIEGLLFSSLSVLLTFFFELCFSLQDVKRLRSSDRGRELHNAGIRATVFNSLGLGAITFYVTVKYCCVPSITATTTITTTTTDTSSSSSSMEFSIILAKQALSILKFLLIENLCYYLVHRRMHTPPFYWMHRFHHNFNTIVLPSSASAVSVPEFIVAYMTPFGIGAKVGGCDKASAMVAAGLVAVFNLVIHTPCLERWMEEWKEKREEKEKKKYDGGGKNGKENEEDGKGGKRGSWWLPPYWWMVSPGDHIMHHRVLNCHYGAPMIHFDRIFDRLNDMMKRMNDLVERRVGGDRGNNSGNLESKRKDA